MSFYITKFGLLNSWCSVHKWQWFYWLQLHTYLWQSIVAIDTLIQTTLIFDSFILALYSDSVSYSHIHLFVELVINVTVSILTYSVHKLLSSDLHQFHIFVWFLFSTHSFLYEGSIVLFDHSLQPNLIFNFIVLIMQYDFHIRLPFFLIIHNLY